MAPPAPRRPRPAQYVRLLWRAFGPLGAPRRPHDTGLKYFFLPTTFFSPGLYPNDVTCIWNSAAIRRR